MESELEEKVDVTSDEITGIGTKIAALGILVGGPLYMAGQDIGALIVGSSLLTYLGSEFCTTIKDYIQNYKSEKKA